MSEIPVHAIRNGAVLAEDVTSEAGQVLVKAGVVLDAFHRELLGRRGVLTVKVRSSADSPQGEPGAQAESAAVLAEQLSLAMRRLDHMFEGLESDPIMRVVLTAAKSVLAARGGANA